MTKICTILIFNLFFFKQQSRNDYQYTGAGDELSVVSALHHSTSHNIAVCAVTHLAPQHGFDSYTGYEVEPDDMQHLEDQQ